MWICHCSTSRNRCQNKGSTFCSFLSRPWVLGLSLQPPVSANQPNPIELSKQWFAEYQTESMELIFLPLRFAASAVVRWCFSWSSFAGSPSNNGWSDSPESVPNLAMSAFCFSIRLNSSRKDWWNPSFNMSRHRLCSYVLRYLLNQDDTKERIRIFKRK